MLEALFHFFGNTWLEMLVVAVIAYLLGSINFAIIVTRKFSKTDIRDYGSGNAGATNVLRSQGVLPAAITAVGDLGKSVVSVLIGRYLFVQFVDPTYEQLEYVGIIGMYVAGFFCVIGHLYPLYFGFRGGKGVITGFGLFLILDYRVALLGLLAFLIILFTTRMVSLGSMVGAWTIVILTFVFRTYMYEQPMIICWFCTVVGAIIAAILTVKHRTNIVRIIKGTENKVSFGKTNRG